MASYGIQYSYVTDSFSMTYQPVDIFPNMQSEGQFSDGRLVPDGDWTAFVTAIGVQANSGVGLTLKLESGDLIDFVAHLQPPVNDINVFFVPYTGRPVTLQAQHSDGTLTLSYSEDQFQWTVVAQFFPPSPVSEAGVVLRYDLELISASGSAGQARLLNGLWESAVEEVWLGEPDVSRRRAAALFSSPPSVSTSSEPYVHTIVGAQFGDLEFDVGKSVRWTSWFVDNVFVLDVNLGTPRYWIVNWTETFPDAQHAVTGINFFALPTQFRAEQWRQYLLAFGSPDEDAWILFIDAHEGLGVDNRTLPDDYDFAPFKSFLWREIQRAQDIGETSVVLPYYVFLRSDNIVNVTYDTPANGLDPTLPPVLQALSVPYYKSYQGLRRLWKASTLRNPSFDWSQLDVPATPSAGCKLQVLSYGYAHWNLQDIEPPQTTVPPIDANNDDGWRMRKLLSRIRPIPGLPVSDTWVPPSGDPAGLPGPWSPADTNNPDPIDPVTGDPMPQPVAADVSLQGLVTPLYDCVFRINMRDGVWYEAGVSGNIPLVWDDTLQQWTTNYDPAKWADRGVKAWDPAAV